MKKVVVTGASGFVGKYVVKSLIENGHEVIAFSRKNIDEACEKYIVDLCDIDELNRINIKAEDEVKVVHLAADISVPGSDETLEKNCSMTKNILEWASRNNCNSFIHISSIPVIGEIIKIPIDESHPVNPNTKYHLSKYKSEILLNEFDNKKIKVVNLRIPSPIGVGMMNNYLSFLLKSFRENNTVNVYGNGGRIQNYMDVRDIANAINMVLKKDVEGLYLIAGEVSISNLELALLCKKLCNSSSEITTNIKEDPEENMKWIISTNKANEAFDFQTSYSLEDTINWIIKESGK